MQPCGKQTKQGWGHRSITSLCKHSSARLQQCTKQTEKASPLMWALLFPKQLPLQLRWHIGRNNAQSSKIRTATPSLSLQRTTNTQSVFQQNPNPEWTRVCIQMPSMFQHSFEHEFLVQAYTWLSSNKENSSRLIKHKMVPPTYWFQNKHHNQHVWLNQTSYPN